MGITGFRENSWYWCRVRVPPVACVPLEPGAFSLPLNFLETKRGAQSLRHLYFSSSSASASGLCSPFRKGEKETIPDYHFLGEVTFSSSFSWSVQGNVGPGTSSWSGIEGGSRNGRGYGEEGRPWLGCPVLPAKGWLCRPPALSHGKLLTPSKRS